MVMPNGYQDYVNEKFNEKIDPKTHCLKLTRAIYGLVQAARQWWKKFKDVLSYIGYFPSRADPWLFIRLPFGQKSYLIIYVEDGGIFCKKESRNKEVMDSLSSYFVVKDLGEMETFVGCKILNNKERDTVYTHQPKTD
jgi:hypothetical protein